MSDSKFNPSPFPMGGPLPEQFSKFFIGQAYLQPLTDKGGQILIVTGGRGWYQAWGEPARELRPGDVVDIPPEVKHWHGAAKDSWFSHLAVEIPAEGASNEWLEPVTDEDYNKL